MPKNKFQEVIFTIIMVFVMVYAMICYNIVLNTGTMTNETFLLAFHELTFMGPIAFILDFFIIGGLAKKIAFGIVDMRRDNPFHLVLAISAVSVGKLPNKKNPPQSSSDENGGFTEVGTRFLCLLFKLFLLR